MPFDNEFAPCRSFLSYSQKEFKCVEYRCSLLPDEPEYGFSFTLQKGSELSGRPSFRPFMAAFGFFRDLMHRSANGEFSAVVSDSALPCGYISADRVVTPRKVEPEAVTRLRSLTELDGDAPISPSSLTNDVIGKGLGGGVN